MSHLAATKDQLSDCKKPRVKRFSHILPRIGQKEIRYIKKRKNERKRANNESTHLARRSIRNPGVVGSGLSGGPMT